ncbi:MAG TPA: DinB family protein [Candidatus Saccharimonadales bacterium]|nr:DinB family protein [Candidatus Saccharimonadales bacterium]
MQSADIALLFDHLYFVRDRILGAARAAPDALVDPAPPTIRDLRTTLVHELDVEWSWRERLDSDHPTSFDEAEEELTVDELPTIDAIEARWREDEAAMRDWLGRLGDAGLEAPCEAEEPSEHPRWFHLLHLYTHGIQQFSDAAVLLTAAGQSPGELDFLDFAETLRGRSDGGS